MFLGSFNKAYNHRDCEYLKSECGIEYDFDAELYNKVEKEIKTVLGDKGKYTGKEAFLFFQQKYSAVAIDLRYYYNYLDSMDIGFGLFDAFTVSNTEDIESLSEACGQFYPYPAGTQYAHPPVGVLPGGVCPLFRQQRPLWGLTVRVLTLPVLPVMSLLSLLIYRKRPVFLGGFQALHRTGGHIQNLIQKGLGLGLGDQNFQFHLSGKLGIPDHALKGFHL